MLKKWIIFILVFNLISIVSYAGNESKYSTSLSRMEREWLRQEYPSDNDETRISRLEEKVFGTIHDIDLKTRYSHLRQAFDVKKMKHRRRPNNLYDFPTSLPMNVDELLGNW